MKQKQNSTVAVKVEPNFAVPPGETLAETLETLSMTQAGLAERMGRPLKTINEIVAGKATITPDTALQLEKVLGVPASFWTNHERIYRDTLARRRDNFKQHDNSTFSFT